MLFPHDGVECVFSVPRATHYRFLRVRAHPIVPRFYHAQRFKIQIQQQAKTAGRAHREKLRETGRLQKNGGETRMANRQQAKWRRREKRRRPQGRRPGEKSSPQGIGPARRGFTQGWLPESPESSDAQKGFRLEEEVVPLFCGQEKLDRGAEPLLANKLELAAVIHRDPVGDEKSQPPTLFGGAGERILA